MNEKDGFLREYKFYKGFNDAMLKKDRESFIKFTFNFTVIYFSYKVKRRMCEKIGHKFVDEGYANPDSGAIVMSCRRCGWSSSLTLY